MGYIYKITNDINDKIYIGKTLNTVEYRFKEHCNDFQRERCEKRPLYDAMNKYGIEHFHAEEVEEIEDPEELSSREIYWINYYDSYHNGYNATLGGDGKSYIDYEEIKKLWDEGKELCQIAKEVKHDVGWVSQILRKKYFISSKEIVQRRINSRGTIVQQYDKQGNFIAEYPSLREASRALLSQGITSGNVSSGETNISRACRGIKKSFVGYIWRYKDCTPK